MIHEALYDSHRRRKNSTVVEDEVVYCARFDAWRAQKIPRLVYPPDGLAKRELVLIEPTTRALNTFHLSYLTTFLLYYI